MKQVAEMLGVELNQEFKVKGFKNIYKLTDNGLEDVTKTPFFCVDFVLYMLLTNQWEIEKPILDKKEKEYLENVIRPFKDKVCYVSKESIYKNYEWIKIKLKNDDSASLPMFKKGSMYKGMENEKEYTLKDLGLFEDE